MGEEIWYNDVAGSNLYVRTCTNAETSAPVGNGVTDVIKNQVVSTGIGNWYYTFNGTAATTIKGIALININTGTWTTIQAQGDDANFAGAPAVTQNFTVLTRNMSKWSFVNKKIEESNRYDAYCKVNWSNQDYRILLNSAAVSAYRIGRIYIFREILEVTHPSEVDMPADITTVSEIIEGDAGQNILIPKYQQFGYEINIQRSNIKAEIDALVNVIGLNPSCCYFVDDLINGGFYFGNFRWERRQVFGPVHGTNKISLTGRFVEGL